jgi:hypothetical protein
MAKQLTQKLTKKYAANLNLFFRDLKHYAVKLKFDIFGKRSCLTFQKWTFLKCPFSENTRTSLFHVFIKVPIFVG